MLKELLKAQFDELVKKLRNTPDGVEAKKLYLQIEALAKTLNITLPSEIKPIVTGEKKGDGECQEPTPSPSPSAGGGLFSLPNLLLAAGAGLFLTGTRGVLPLGLLGAGAFMKFKGGVTGINGPDDNAYYIYKGINEQDFKRVDVLFAPTRAEAIKQLKAKYPYEQGGHNVFLILNGLSKYLFVR